MAKNSTNKSPQSSEFTMALQLSQITGNASFSPTGHTAAGRLRLASALAVTGDIEEAISDELNDLRSQDKIQLIIRRIDP